jgi:hypothetical protein
MRSWAFAAAASLALSAAAPAAAEPLDLDLTRLGAPSAAVWEAIGANLTPGVAVDPATAAQLASDAKLRFATLSAETALAFSSPLLQPASTTGHSGFDFALEAAYAQVHPAPIGQAVFPSSPEFGARTPWQTRGLVPHELFLPSFHVRKALPFSFELGGRVTYLSQSSYFAAQVEGKWALNEGFAYIPDVALRAAHTQLLGQRDWNLGATDFGLLVSKRWGVNAVSSLTPYAAARYTFVRASSETMDFGPVRPAGSPGDPADLRETQASFPSMRKGLYRTTVGLRLTAYLVSMAVEATYFAGATISGERVPAADQYPDVELASSWTGAFRFGWEF